MSETVTNQSEQPIRITLDGQPVTIFQINEAKNKPGIRIIEQSPGCYKTLQRLNG